MRQEPANHSSRFWLAPIASVVFLLSLASPSTMAHASGLGSEPMPNLIGLSKASAWRVLRADQLFFSTKGPGAANGSWQRVVGEIPAAGTTVPVRSTVILEVSTTPVATPKRVVHRPRRTRVPALVGQSLSFAVWRSHLVGFHIRVVHVGPHRGPFTSVALQRPRGNLWATAGATITVDVRSYAHRVRGQAAVPGSRTVTVTPPASASHVKVGIATYYYYIPGQCATWYLPRGTRIWVKDEQTGKVITCVATDREGAHGRAAVDLDAADFAALAPLGQGVIPVRVWW